MKQRILYNVFLLTIAFLVKKDEMRLWVRVFGDWGIISTDYTSAFDFLVGEN